MKVTIRAWGLKLVALSVLGFAGSGLSAQADEILPLPGGVAGAGVAGPLVDGPGLDGAAIGGPGVDGALAGVAGPVGPAGTIGAALDAVGVIPFDGPGGDPGPIAGGPIGGPGIDGAIAPPPGPPLLHHFANIMRYPIPGGFQDFRTELMLFGDNTFQMILPVDSFGGPGFAGRGIGGPGFAGRGIGGPGFAGRGFGGPGFAGRGIGGPGFAGRGFCGPGAGPAAVPAGPITILGTWALVGDELIVTYDSGWRDVGLMTISPVGPRLRFEGRRWADILVLPQ
jgi:hypothetical protein